MKFSKKILKAINEGVYRALADLDDEEDISLSKSNIDFFKSDRKYNELKFIDSFIDLDLPSGNLWRQFNFGVDPNMDDLNNIESWLGLCFAWGELESSAELIVDNYKFYDKKHLVFTKYNNFDEQYKLLLEDDIAYLTSHKSVIPSVDDFYELLDNTKQYLVFDFNSIKGLNGIIFSSMKNSDKFIFIPANPKFLDAFGEPRVILLTSNINEIQCGRAYNMVVSSSDAGWISTYNRQMCLPIREVIKKYSLNEKIQYNALSDLDDEEDVSLSKSNIDFSKSEKNYLLFKLDDYIDKFICSKDINVLNDILELLRKFNCKYLVKSKDQLRNISNACYNLIDNLNWIDTSKLTDISFLTKGFTEYFNFDISEWDVSNIENAEQAFQDCSNFNCDLTNWKLCSLENGKYMFINCRILSSAPQLPKIKLVKSECYQSMFCGCYNLTIAPELPATELTDNCYSSMFSGSGIINMPELPAKTLKTGCYCGMFTNCKNLIAIKVLPATELAERCYSAMFASSLIDKAPELPATKLAEACYYSMFYNCTYLTDAPDLPATILAPYCYHSMFAQSNIKNNIKLPAKTLELHCYSNMFHDCKNLHDMPELPATTLANSCYGGMFNGCTHLSVILELPAKILKYGCYNNMFSGCINLENAPELPAVLLAPNCYKQMFAQCYKLLNAPILPAMELEDNCYRLMFYSCKRIKEVTCYALKNCNLNNLFDWLRNTSNEGNFYKLKNSEYPVEAIPENWVVKEI